MCGYSVQYFDTGIIRQQSSHTLYRVIVYITSVDGHEDECTIDLNGIVGFLFALKFQAPETETGVCCQLTQIRYCDVISVIQ